MNYLPFSLFIFLLLLRDAFKIILLSGHVVQRTYNLAIIWDVHSQKATTPKKACASFLLVGGDIAAILLMTSIGI